MEYAPLFYTIRHFVGRHLSGAIIGTICAFSFMGYGPQKPDPFANEEEEESVSATDETDNIETDEEEEEHEIDAE